MRITNTMISDGAALNINGNKISVDANNTRMTTQKKIDRPSEDPVIAIRSLRLQTSLAKINQYYEKNIPDAKSWMDVTETALLNIRDIMTDVRTLCVKGSTDTLTEDDRKTIYTQLKKLQEQCFAEGNADYAGRTVFTGFRTDKNLAFMTDDKYTRYDIEEPLEAEGMKKSRFYTNEVDVPTNPADVKKLYVGDEELDDDTSTTQPGGMTIEESDFYKLRLSYNLKNTSDSVTALNFYDKVVVNGNDTLVSRTSIELKTAGKKGSTEEGIVLSSGNEYTVVDASAQTGYTDGTIQMVYQFENEADWAEWSKQQEVSDEDARETYYRTNGTKFSTKTKADGSVGYCPTSKFVPDGAVVIIKETGDAVFGNDVATKLMTEKDNLSFDYTKTGFNKGELRPEYYFDCVLRADENGNEQGAFDSKTQTYQGIRYDRYDKEPQLNADGSKKTDANGNVMVTLTKKALYSLDYTIAQNQTLGINLEAEECFNHDIYQDMSDMIDAVSKSQEAHDKVEKIKAMQKEDQYQATPYAEKLESWLEMAQKEMDYYDNNLSKLYSSTLGQVDSYLNKINLAITDLGCRSDQLVLTEKRMSDQQETVEELKSNNDNLDLSQIIMDYTSSYTAYQSSLIAAGKLGEQTLLNYI